ncbi:MAG: formate dehydrogenase [Pseudomonadota bacterium]|nr:formate dehydrogenase [Pseudomonadota bacterium]
MIDVLHHDSSAVPLRAAHSTDANRRRFLLAFGAGAAGAASASALAATPVAIVAPAEAKPEAQGYRETEHVRRYYATTRL